MAVLIFAPESSPDVSSFFGLSVGTLIAGCLIAAFMVLAICYGFLRIWKLNRHLDLVSEETQVRKQYEEELAAIGTRPTPSRQRRDPWGN